MNLTPLVVNIVDKACGLLRTELLQNTLEKHGIDLEPVVVEAIKRVSADFPTFDIEVELVSGQKFPDIVLSINGKKVGIEIKTTKSDKWVTLGGSITESTKVDDLVDIFVLFGRTNIQPPEFRFRRFSECANSVKITHSPRFTIDMETPDGESVFEHIGVPYEDLNKREDKMVLFRKYLKEKAGPNADVWWLESDAENLDSSGFSTDAIRSFDSLSSQEREQLRLEVLAIFPELFSLKDTYKYHSATRYVAARYGVVDHCFRDRFTSGGQVDWNSHGIKVPKIIKNLIEEERLIDILDKLDNISIQVLEEYWRVSAANIKGLGRRKLWVEWVLQNIGRNDSNLADHLRPLLVKFLK
ncbi:MAG: hypothetical protein R3273_09010 [Pseudidiomarina maritima]|nr:hypothetical protein [Pseudidiomarina maritima]